MIERGSVHDCISSRHGLLPVTAVLQVFYFTCRWYSLHTSRMRNVTTCLQYGAVCRQPWSIISPENSWLYRIWFLRFHQFAIMRESFMFIAVPDELRDDLPHFMACIWCRHGQYPKKWHTATVLSCSSLMMFIDTSGIRVRNRISNTWRSWQIPRGGSSTWGGLSSSVKVPKRYNLDVTALPKNKISTVTTCTTYMQQLCRPIFFRWCARNWLDDPHCLDGIETTKRTSSPVNSDPVLEYSAPCPTCPLARSLDVHEKDKERLHQWIELMSLGLCLFDSFSFKWFVICDLFFGRGGGGRLS